MIHTLHDVGELLQNGLVRFVGKAEIVGLFAETDHFPGQVFPAFAALGPDFRKDHVHAQLVAFLLQQGDLRLGVLGEPVDGHHGRQAEGVLHVGDVLQQVRQPLLQGSQVFAGQLILASAAVMLEGSDGGYHHHRVGLEPGHAALDIEEFLRAQVRAEAGLCDAVIAQLQCQFGGGYTVAAVGDVGEGPAVDQRRGMFQGLDQVRLQGVLQQRRHGARRLQIPRGHGPIVVGVPHHDSGQPRLQIRDPVSEAQHRHDLAGHGDVEAILPGRAVGLAAETVHNEAKLPIIHVHRTLPGDAAGIDAQGVPLLDVVVQHGGQQVVGSADGMEVASKVQVDVLHGHHLGVAAAGRAALDAEHGPQ